MSEQPLLRVEHLSLTRDGHTILRDINLSVHPGRVHALAGVNGSGKSSLAYALMGCAGYEAEARNTLAVVVRNDRARVTHEAAIGTVNKKELETLMARGLDEDAAVDVIIRGILN